MNRKTLILATFIVLTATLGIGLRLTTLQSIPTAFTHDEIYYAVQSRFIAATGSDLTGNWQPWSLTSAHPLFAELPGVIISSGHDITSNPLLAVRIPSVVIGFGISLLLAIISYQLFRKKSLAIIVALLSLFNPWSFQFSRMLYDAWFSTFFYLAGIALVLSNRKWLVLLSMPVFALGFFQYQGMKLLLIPLLLSQLVFKIWNTHITKKDWLNKSIVPSLLRQLWPYLLVFVFALSITGWFMLQLSSQVAQSRSGDLLVPTRQTVLELSAKARELTLAPNWYARSVASSLALVRTYTEKLAHIFSSDRLFMQGNTLRDSTTVTTAGLFHLADAVLIILGLLALSARRYRPAGLLLLSWVAIATIPSLLNATSDWPLYRAFFIVPPLLIIAGLGLQLVLEKLPRYGCASVLLMYAFSSLYFLSEYFYKYPIYSSENAFYAKRILASYAWRAGLISPVAIRVDEPDFAYLYYLLVRPNLTKQSAQTLQSAMSNKLWVDGQVVYDNACLKLSDLDTTLVVDDSIAPCHDQQLPDIQSRTTIAVPPHTQSYFTILNDQLCQSYIKPTTLAVQSVLEPLEQLSDEEFCQTFIVQADR